MSKEKMLETGYENPRHDRYFCYFFDEEITLGKFDIETITETESKSPTPVVHLSHPSTPKRTKKPPCAQQESQCARRLKERIAQKGGLSKEFMNINIVSPNLKKRFTFAPNINHLSNN